MPDEERTDDGHGGGSGCGWLAILIAMVAAVGSLYVSASVGVGSVTQGATGMPAEAHDLAGVLVLVALVALGMTRRGER